MSEALAQLLADARRRPFTEEDWRRQAISFAYGNVALENPRVTRAQVAAAVERLVRSRGAQVDAG